MRAAPQYLRLAHVGRDDGGGGDQFALDYLGRVLLDEAVAACGYHHGVIHHPLWLVAAQGVGYGADDIGVVHHAYLYGLRLDVLHHGVDLVGYDLRRYGEDAAYAERVLHRDGRYGRCGIGPECRYGLYVGLYARAARGVGTRNREYGRRA